MADLKVQACWGRKLLTASGGCTMRVYGSCHTNRLAERTHCSEFLSTMAYIMHIANSIHTKQSRIASDLAGQKG